MDTEDLGKQTRTNKEDDAQSEKQHEAWEQNIQESKITLLNRKTNNM